VTGPWHPTGRARVSSRRPEAQSVCDRCGLNYSLSDLQWQYQWQGMQLQNLRLLVCRTCLDVPQIQLKTIILPPDPLPVLNPRPENYDAEVPSYAQTLVGVQITQVSGTEMNTMIQVTPTPDPNNSYLVPPDF